MNHSLKTLLIFLASTFGAAAIGGTATGRSIRDWYPTLRKPAVNPPSWIFGPVWTMLYLMMAVAAWLDWRRGRNTPIGKQALGLFAGQLGLNALWSILFFGLRAPGLALLEIVGLWAAIAAWLATSLRVDRRAAALIAPYLAWVSFASYLNFRIWKLNQAPALFGQVARGQGSRDSE